MRKTLVKLGEKELKGEYLFDGTMLFATRRLDGTVINVKDPAVSLFNICLIRRFLLAIFIRFSYKICPKHVLFMSLVAHRSIWTCRISNICYSLLQASAVEKIKTNIRNSTRPNR